MSTQQIIGYVKQSARDLFLTCNSQCVHPAPAEASIFAVPSPIRADKEQGAPEGLWSAQKWHRTTAHPVLPDIILSDNKKVKGGQNVTEF